MSGVCLNSVDFDEYDKDRELSFAAATSPAANFHNKIFAQDAGCALKNTVVLPTARSEIEKKIQKVAQSNNVEISSMGVGGSGEVGVDISWGGRDGVEISGYAKGEVHDDKGNYAEAKAEQNSDGTGKATVSAGHEKD